MHDIIELYMQQGSLEGWSRSTVKQYRWHLEIMETILRQRACRRLADVTPADLDAVMAKVATEAQARHSRQQLGSTIKRFFRWLQEHGRIVSNPALNLPLPAMEEDVLPEAPLSEDEVRTLIESLPCASTMDLRNRCMIEMLYGCGLRLAEAVALNIDDLDCERQTVHVRCGKGHQQRVMPLMKTARAAALDYLALRRNMLHGPDHGALFLSRVGKRWSRDGVVQWMGLLNRQRGPDARHVHAHLFRHSIAVHLLRGGADVHYIQQFLGHADLDTTKIYLRMVPGRLKEEYEKAMPDIAVGEIGTAVAGSQ